MSHNIDHCFYINLDKRTDRQDEIETELQSFGWTSTTTKTTTGQLQYERVQGIEHAPPMGILGCGKSHLKALKLAKERGYKNILILEDDFMFVLSKEVVEERLQQCFDRFNNNPGTIPPFDVCFLAHALHSGEVVQDCPILTRAYKSQSASGYIVNQHYYDTLIKLYEFAMPKLEETQMHWVYANDIVWFDLQSKDRWFCFTERLGLQRPSFSDNSQQFMDRKC